MKKSKLTYIILPVLALSLSVGCTSSKQDSNTKPSKIENKEEKTEITKTENVSDDEQLIYKEDKLASFNKIKVESDDVDLLVKNGNEYSVEIFASSDYFYTSIKEEFEYKNSNGTLYIRQKSKHQMEIKRIEISIPNDKMVSIDYTSDDGGLNIENSMNIIETVNMNTKAGDLTINAKNSFDVNYISSQFGNIDLSFENIDAIFNLNLNDCKYYSDVTGKLVSNNSMSDKETIKINTGKNRININANNGVVKLQNKQNKKYNNDK